MSADASLAPYLARLESCAGLRWHGRVTQVIGPLVESEGPFCSVGEICHIHDSHGRVLPGEIIGFRGSTVLAMPLDLPRGVRHGDRVVTWGEHATLRVSEEMLGRVIDGRGSGPGCCDMKAGLAMNAIVLAAFSVLQPGYVHVLFHDPEGIKILKAAIILDLMAFITIRRILRVKF